MVCKGCSKEFDDSELYITKIGYVCEACYEIWGD